MLLGCIADDFTGATDLANTLTRQGMRTVQTIGIPSEPPGDADAVVVALKSRTIPAAEAVAQSVAACRWLTGNGARQIFFKYCSTFDSTDKGNIGPVTEALMQELGASITTVCPAFPENRRTIYLGHLFVGEVLLSDSSMRNHPLTPMTDSNLVTVMARQSRRKVANIPYGIVRQGAAAIRAELSRLAAAGISHAVVDSLADQDLLALGEACADLRLATGGSGAALGLPENFRRMGLLKDGAQQQSLPVVGGPAIVLSGSCSAATLQQVERFKADHPALALDLEALFMDRAGAVARAVEWAVTQQTPALIYSSAAPAAVAELQKRHGRDQAGEVIEHTMGDIAAGLAGRNFRRFVVAGGETSGAVTKALGVTSLDIGAQITPGVPATQSRGTPRFGLVLKSGNFGGPEFFREALEAIP